MARSAGFGRRRESSGAGSLPTGSSNASQSGDSSSLSDSSELSSEEPSDRDRLSRIAALILANWLKSRRYGLERPVLKLLSAA